nr:serine-rich adhesin for platelets-like [Lytechinus pictus]
MELLFLILIAACLYVCEAQNCTFSEDLCGYTNGGSDQLQWLRTENPSDPVPFYLSVDLTTSGRISLATLTSPTISKEPGQRYLFSFDYRVTGDHTLHVRASGAGGGGWEHTGDTDGWENAVLVLAPPSDMFNILIVANIGEPTVFSRIQISNLFINSDANDNCDPSPCQNGGECYDLGTDAICLCINGFSGETCEIAPSTAPPPTTAQNPATDELTTVEDTTFDPTTNELTTVEPTTVVSTTDEITTVDPTTLDPTEENPSTSTTDIVNPTTLNPNTIGPSTFVPTTEQTTEDSTTLEATSQSATTAQLTTMNMQSTETTMGTLTNTATTAELTSQITTTGNAITDDVSTVQLTTITSETGVTTSGQETPEATVTGEMTSIGIQTTEYSTEATATTNDATEPTITTEDTTEVTGNTAESISTEVQLTTGYKEPTEQVLTEATTSTTEDVTDGSETSQPPTTDTTSSGTEGEVTEEDMTTDSSTTSSNEPGNSNTLTDVTTGLIIGLSLTMAILLILLAFTLLYYCTHRDRYGVSEETMENGNATQMNAMKPGTSQVYENPYVTAPAPSSERSTQTSLSAINV